MKSYDGMMLWGGISMKYRQPSFLLSIKISFYFPQIGNLSGIQKSIQTVS